ncbi:uncharacterized protein BX663DRAFT_483440 [Cokeromyces recurvatus]|uniref:uncharacterized protein n=1 Tax=Cokeromyces recurvatus TaxID=90255 RepID=UPI002220DBF7|nr:uncharacterized protein BX663DRAFT_483440 [Cokeromyces recurvatus]KAI7906751.1 hypothetical protein BX663DRAFT_483440 [Cokeromyces recurvatus]
MAEYLSLNKNIAREVKEGIMYIHRRKSKMLNSMNDSIVISNLRSGNLLEEGEIYKGKVTESSEDQDNDESSISDSELDLESTGGSSSGVYGSDTDDEADSVVDYPYDPDIMKNARPSRILIAINDKIIEAILDTGTAVSMISKKLADRLTRKQLRQNTPIWFWK